MTSERYPLDTPTARALAWVAALGATRALVYRNVAVIR